MKTCILVALTAVLALSLAGRCLSTRQVADIAVTDDGSIYVLDTSNDEVLKFTEQGKLDWRKPISLSSPGSKDTTKSQSYRLAPGGAGTARPQNLMVISTLAGVREITPTGDISDYFAPIGAYTDRLLAADGFGQVFFPNKEKNRVERYISNTPNAVPAHWSKPQWQTYLDKSDVHPVNPGITNGAICNLVIDGKVDGPGHLSAPHMVSVDWKGGSIWVLDQSYRFKVFDGWGRYKFAVKAPDELNRAFTSASLEFDHEGNAYVSSAEKRCIYKFDKDGKLDTTVPVGYWIDALGLDPAGNLYVYHQDDHAGEIRVLNQSGKQINAFPIPK